MKPNPWHAEENGGVSEDGPVGLRVVLPYGAIQKASRSGLELQIIAPAEAIAIHDLILETSFAPLRHTMPSNPNKPPQNNHAVAGSGTALTLPERTAHA